MNKEKEHIDSQFINHSWQEMSKLLDKELPVKKKKRRFIWVWFFGFGLLVSALTFQYFNQKNNINPKSIEENSNTIIASKKRNQQSNIIQNKAIKDSNDITFASKPQKSPNPTKKYQQKTHLFLIGFRLPQSFH